MTAQTNDDQKRHAERFAAAHRDGPIVVLPNAFDVATARVIARRSPVAIGTTSAGIAWGLGYPDGELISRSEMLEAAKRIVEAVDIGVTLDMEAGYGDSPGEAAEMAVHVIEIGAIGINLEDVGNPSGSFAGRLLPVDQAAAKIAAVRAVAKDIGIELVINARTDTFRETGDQIAHAIERGNAYLEAGADCVFTPGIVDREGIARLVDALNGPLNVYATPTTPSVNKLAELGVRRVSVGCGPYQACLALVDRIARELLEDGIYDGFALNQLSVGEITTLLGS
jgi:2-methylisocitrate lyase-like PEP mutase family enzyme